LDNFTIDDLVGCDGTWKIFLAVLGILSLPCGLFNFVVVLAVVRLGILVPVVKSLFKKSPLKRSIKKKVFTYVVSEMSKSTSRIINFLIIQSPNDDSSHFSGRFQNIVQSRSRQYSPSPTFFSEIEDDETVV